MYNSNTKFTPAPNSNYITITTDAVGWVVLGKSQKGSLSGRRELDSGSGFCNWLQERTERLQK